MAERVPLAPVLVEASVAGDQIEFTTHGIISHLSTCRGRALKMHMLAGLLAYPKGCYCHENKLLAINGDANVPSKVGESSPS